MRFTALSFAAAAWLCSCTTGSESPAGQPPDAAPQPTDAGAGADAPITPPPDVTQGSGGPTGLVELTSATGLKYRINAPVSPPESAHGLLVLLHGSTASNYANFMTIMARVATDLDLIPVSVLAPNGQGWNEGGSAAQVQAADRLDALIKNDVFPKYNIDKRRIVFSGQSSGGGFLGTHFVPLHAKDYRGGALLQCGSAPPAVAFAPDAATKQAFRLHFEITTGDQIWPDSYARALVAYGQAGMMLTKDATKPGGHCAFDQSQVIRDHIAFILPPR
jgi:hypothetical protein